MTSVFSAVPLVEDTAADLLVAEQGDLSAVERFAQRHEDESAPLHERRYRDLIPLTRPEPGQQYAFEVDLDACTGCKSCVAACHSLNGLDEGESWRSVSLLKSRGNGPAFQQTVTAGCHHCVDPACLAGCPVDAYEKDPVTGAVVHLDDQCIGCSYCTLTCPYDVPLFNRRQGIVRKCDLCHGRLAAGEAPACVQACPNGAITIKVVDTAAAVAASERGPLLPGLPPSSLTRPTTTYRTANPERLAGLDGRRDAGPMPVHLPLAVMLVLTQVAVGAFTVDWLDAGRTAGPVLGVGAAVMAMGASVLHLGRPRYFYRAVIGLRHSWLSREVLAFGAFTGLGVLAAIVPALGWAAVAAGWVGVACSVLIYTSTRRAAWSTPAVAFKFAGTAAVGGLVAVAWARGLAGVWPLAAGVAAAKLIAEATVLRSPRVAGTRRLVLLRFAGGVVGGVVLPLGLAWLLPSGSLLAMAVGTLAVIVVVAGELAERALFFVTVGPVA